MSGLVEKITVNGTEHTLVLLRVDSWLDDEPEAFRLVELDRTCELSEDPKENHFLTAYIPTKQLGKRT